MSLNYGDLNSFFDSKLYLDALTWAVKREIENTSIWQILREAKIEREKSEGFQETNGDRTETTD